MRSLFPLCPYATLPVQGGVYRPCCTLLLPVALKFWGLLCYTLLKTLVDVLPPAGPTPLVVVRAILSPPKSTPELNHYRIGTSSRYSEYYLIRI